MCGIAGYISKEHIDPQILVRMADRLARRGPDGSGYYYDSDAGCEIGIAHRRLSVMDPSENGSQPMVSENGAVVLSFNGEIYNFKDLRRGQQARGCSFRSECDTEVLLNSYLEDGIRSAENFHGMFAYAVYDKEQKKLFLVRDRMGEKPLYYSFSSRYFCFASDLNALREFSLYRPELNVQALQSYMWNQYIPAPQTIYQNTYKLRSGSILSFDMKTGKVKEEVYWDLLRLHEETEPCRREKKNETYYIDGLHEVLKKAVRERMAADVPLGVYLSGGIDSSLVSALARQRGKQIDTYSIGFREEGYDEAGYARQVAGALGTRHHELYISMQDAMELVQQTAECYSEPFADNSQLPTMLLSRFARQDVTVALSGDGGDELFCGYPNFIQKQRMYLTRHASKLLRATTGRERMKKPYAYRDWILAKACTAYSAENIINLDYITAEQITGGLFLEREEKNQRYFDAIPDSGKLAERCMTQFMQLYLQEDIMAKVDRASMYYSLEMRAPFLDQDVVEFSLGMPLSMKYRKGELKYPLKKILCQYISKELIDRPKKGFGVPISLWLHGEFQKLLSGFFDRDFLRSQNIFNVEEMECFYRAFMEKPTVILDRIMWSVMLFQLWYGKQHL
ncbi:asparagine synthase (glutamine-hydrolyzing) [Lachnoclostridium sp. Marseille-P6806]|uniref:asparagine synthase (glutamine-hydrolyzing) n=1 Tax=Lachnoclostridium sp. Marseille-P6806 TaxID=2364793 RepID=UPI0010306750|nr:asparagine synthase (glutamine-hydrolyzing) [Lachnoclostridium sp. Marseille-P6806]